VFLDKVNTRNISKTVYLKPGVSTFATQVNGVIHNSLVLFEDNISKNVLNTNYVNDLLQN
jgi:hypothetical protein